MSEQLIPDENPFLAEKISTVRKHRWPYYKEQYGQGVKKLLDVLHLTGVTKRIAAQGISVDTLRQQYYQGAAYLLDNLDDAEGTYKKRYRKTHCRSDRHDGYIEISIRLDISSMEVTDDTPRWRDELLEFIEAAKPGDTFNRRTVLSPVDQAWVRQNLDAFGDQFVYQLTDRELLVIRDNPTQ